MDWSNLYLSTEGRLGRPALTQFRALLLGLWPNLPDATSDVQLTRNIMFRKAFRLQRDGGVPQASTTGHF